MRKRHDDDAAEFEWKSRRSEQKCTFWNAVLWLVFTIIVLRFALKFDFPEFVVKILEVIE